MDEAELRELLREAGLKLTPPRLLIISLLAGRDRSFTAAEVLDALQRRHPEVGRATLFRTFDLLISLGALERLRLPAGQEGYILCRPPHHHHVVCTSCGAVGEVEAARLESTLEEVVQASGFKLQTHTLELSGVCTPCDRGHEPGTNAVEPTSPEGVAH